MKERKREREREREIERERVAFPNFHPFLLQFFFLQGSHVFLPGLDFHCDPFTYI
jgi:hypothetical protein